MTVLFRDPPPPVEQARRLEEELARVLVGAPKLPVWLPLFHMSLEGVVAEANAFVLRFGVGTGLLASVRVARPSAEGPAELTVVERGLDDPRLDRLLAVMSARLSVAITAERFKEARARARRLRVIDVSWTALRQVVDGTDPPGGLVRTGFRCNQDCGLCWQDRTWGDVGPTQVRTWIEDLARAGIADLTLSGGEPTLDPELVEHVAFARSLGFTRIALETNAIKMAKPGVAERLRDAGVTECFVSLHSADAAVSDAITRAPGTHARTVKGIAALLAAGVAVRVNAVMTAEGLDTLPSLPDFLDAQFGRPSHLLGLALSFPATPFDRGLRDVIVPEPERTRAVLARVVPRAHALGLSLSGLAGPCGAPLCAFGADPRVVDRAHVAPPVPFRRFLPGCASCSVRRACYGVRHEDAERFGERCIEPLRD